MLEELWFNLDGEELEILFQNARYKNGKPDQTNYLSKAESRRNIGDRFGRKIRPSLKPPWMENINSGSFPMTAPFFELPSLENQIFEIS